MRSNRIFVHKKGFKYFIGYKHDEKAQLLHMFPKMTGYRKSFDEAKYMSFLIKDDLFFFKKKSIRKSPVK